MLISIDWISDFVKLPENLSSQEIGNRFTMATAEVEDIFEEGKVWEQIYVAEIIEFEKHPEADKLNIVTFSIGNETKRVVCGASNVKVGLKTPFAPLGVTLPIGFTLEPKKIRGILSEGMLCSEEELGLKEKSSGIMELPNDAPVGYTLAQYWNKKKQVLLDIDNKSLTHRPDLWGHFGMAREFAAAFECKLNNPFDLDWETKVKALFNNKKAPITPIMEDGSAGKIYLGLTIEGVEVKESPSWIKDRLEACGLRSINNIVDISNYVMLELGIPNHIFDRDKISGDRIFIKRLTQETEFITLDEVERTLIPGDTVIADNHGPLVIGGLMGGLKSGVTENTNSVFIEVANWHAYPIRNTSNRLGLRTDSSQRYEKSLDSLLCRRTILRLTELIVQQCPKAKVIGNIVSDGEDLNQIPIVELKSNVTHIEKVLGKSIGRQKIISILESLDFKVCGNGDDLIVLVPSYRATKDIDCEADLVEEIGRIIGYDHISPISPKLDIFPVKLDSVKSLHRKIRQFLVNNGHCSEVLTYPMVGENMLKKAMWPTFNNQLKLVNSISKEADRMRPSLLPSMLEACAKNVKYKSEFGLFEIGRTYHPDEKNFATEKNNLIIAKYHASENQFLNTVNITERLLKVTNIPGNIVDPLDKFPCSLIDTQWAGYHPFEVQNIRIMGKMHGIIMSIHPIVLREYKIKGQLTIAIIDFSSFESRPLKDNFKYSPLPKYPGSTFDWTIVAKKSEKIENILNAARKVKIKELQRLSIADLFSPGGDDKFVTLRAEFLDPDKTLDREFLEKSTRSLIEMMKSSGYPLKE
ncbi:MAG: phenylalanine--tRNA ligase subunit beta [Halobacteriovoraceae bacterium]|nr:phenylalanine--tRNA ligase subunit beta [Halobacteriovoraceae bacterium]